MADTQLPEVAEDYKSSLEFLTANDRYAINNFTVIAKENTEHALAISRVLEEHIKKAPPNHKLPAMYVLDSIAKNIGTPYTLFLGHNLYTTFMDAYCLVESPIRKKLDEMLKTWKEPVPGSKDPRPVFPPEKTRPIETALIQAKTVALQRQQQQAQTEQDMFRKRGSQMGQVYQQRNVATPPQNLGRYPTPPQNVSLNNVPGPVYGSYPSATPPVTSSPYGHAPSVYGSHGQQQHPTPYPDVAELHRDIENLIGVARLEFTNNFHDVSIQTRLKALLDLQSILQSQQLPPQQLLSVRNHVTQLAGASRPPSSLGNPHVPLQTYTPTLPMIVPLPKPLQHVSSPAPQPVIPSAASLADLLASAARAKAASTSQLNTSSMTQPHPSFSKSTVATEQDSVPNASSLLASLRAAGMIPSAASTPVQSSRTLQAPLTQSNPSTKLLSTPSSLVQLLKSAQSRPASGIELNNVPTSFRKCTKLAQTNARRARLADSMRRGQSRMWYVDELEWIRSRGGDEDDASVDGGGRKDSALQALASAVKNDPKSKFIPVPSDSALASAPCAICQERFETSWSDETQDFVWRDAVQIGSRIYHASCHNELRKDGGHTPRISTPDSILGKRKAPQRDGLRQVSAFGTPVDNVAAYRAVVAFTKDLLADPTTRDVHDIKHKVVAAASSSSASRAQKFLEETKCPSEAKAYGSYMELVNDPNVDIIYVATPHSHHYQNCMLALEAGKHVLCEKAFTVNAPQTKILVETARTKKLFLMEAVWTRYFPMSIEIRKIIESGALGTVYRTSADLSMNMRGGAALKDSHRMVNLDLAGGALLDLGIYSLTWVFQTLYHTLPANERVAPTVASTMTKHDATGADALTTMILTFPKAPHAESKTQYAHGIATTSLYIDSASGDASRSRPPSIRIQGTKGEIQVAHPAFKPASWKVVWGKEAGDGKAGTVEDHKQEFPSGHGMFWEGDEAARCVRDGKLESEGLGWEESIVIMEVMDKVREQAGLRYPEAIESTEYPIDLPGAS
ncbi:hypothetical protein MMC25_008153 [Agyrium rufum]|nr:hypothetical protein [Agyrium rufum]